MSGFSFSASYSVKVGFYPLITLFNFNSDIWAQRTLPQPGADIRLYLSEEPQPIVDISKRKFAVAHIRARKLSINPKHA